MSLPLRDGPGGDGRPPNRSSNGPSFTSPREDDDFTLFTHGENTDALLDSVLQDNHNKPKNTTKPAETKDVDGFIDDLLFAENDDRSDSESTALSSLVPFATSAQIRANAPRVGVRASGNVSDAFPLAGINEQPTATTNVFDTTDDIVNPSERSDPLCSHDDNKKDEDEITLDPNRPIDQVFIHPASSNASALSCGPANMTAMSGTGGGGHRHRRQYHTGGRHNVAGSTKSRAGGNLSNTVMSEARTNGSTGGGILESLGLGGGGTTSKTSALSTADGISEGTMGSQSKKKYPYSQRHRYKTSPLANAKLNQRTFVVLTGLVTMVYLGLQLTALIHHNSQVSRQQARLRHGHLHYDHEEGVDRPFHGGEIVTIGKRPSKISLNAVRGKVPVAQEGPKHLLDKASIMNGSDDTEIIVVDASAVENGKVSQQEELVRVGKGEVVELEEAPVDALPPPEAEKEISLSVSRNVVDGLAGVYTKDKMHRDTPLLWYIPRSGGSIVKDIASQCQGLTVASEVGGTNGGDKTEARVVDVAGYKYVNVDTTTVEGIEQAKNLNLVSSGLAELIVSPHIVEAASLFSSSQKGRAFTLMRHPVERAVSMFYFLQKNKFPAVNQMSLEDYARSPYVENNWMVRVLSGHWECEIGEAELDIAKEILRTKVVVGLLEQKELSMARFEYYFGWEYTSNPALQTACRSRILTGDFRTNARAKGKVKEGSEAWSLLLWQNQLDMQLYKSARSLFLQQGTELFSDMPRHV